MSTTRWYSSLEHRVKSSLIRRTYWAVAKRQTLISSQREEGFYRNLLVGLQHDDLIFDVGANQGAKTDVFLRLGARVVAVEPDDACQQILRDRFLRYRLKPCPVTLIGKAVSNKIGTEKMWIDGPGSAVNTISRKWADRLKEDKESFKYGHCGLEFSSSKPVETTTVEHLVNLHGVPFFVKIDVEGHELSVLLGMRRPVPYLSFEVNLRTFRHEGIECVRVLSRLQADGRFNYTPDCCSGLILRKWLSSEEFCAVIDSCSDETIEVFWRSNCSLVRPSNTGLKESLSQGDRT
jgi:FkbM family methyltransferase